MDATGPTGGIESGTGDAGTGPTGDGPTGDAGTGPTGDGPTGDGPTGDVGTGPTGDAGTNIYYPGYTGMPPPEPVPDFLSLDDLLSDHEILVAKEQADKNLLDQIGSQHVLALKPKLVEWVGAGKPHAYPVIMLNIQPPTKCSDGVERNLPDYITFCSGKSIEQHVGLLQSKLSGISVSFANIGGQVAIVVSP